MLTMMTAPNGGTLDEDEVDSVADSPHKEMATAAMHNSILEPIEMPAWVGARHRSSSFHSSSSFNDSSNEFWKYRGTRVDPSALKFASTEQEEAPTSGFRLPIPFPTKSKPEADAEEVYNVHAMNTTS